MNVAYSEKAAKSSRESHHLQEVTTRLEEVPGSSANSMNVEWDQIKDEKGRPLYTLRISDFDENVTASFSPEELASASHMRVRLYHLWGDFLQARNMKQLQKLNEGGD